MKVYVLAPESKGAYSVWSSTKLLIFHTALMSFNKKLANTGEADAKGAHGSHIAVEVLVWGALPPLPIRTTRTTILLTAQQSQARYTHLVSL